MQDSEGMITNKKFIPAHTILLWTGKVAIPQYHHDAWKIEVKIENKTVKKRILKILYDSLNIGDKVMVRYGTGRFRGKFYVKSISAIK